MTLAPSLSIMAATIRMNVCLVVADTSVSAVVSFDRLVMFDSAGRFGPVKS